MPFSDCAQALVKCLLVKTKHSFHQKQKNLNQMESLLHEGTSDYSQYASGEDYFT
jgi:hypothetical protein